jgi:hypothetical protein
MQSQATNVSSNHRLITLVDVLGGGHGALKYLDLNKDRSRMTRSSTQLIPFLNHRPESVDLTVPQQIPTEINVEASSPQGLLEILRRSFPPQVHASAAT